MYTRDISRSPEMVSYDPNATETKLFHAPAARQTMNGRGGAARIDRRNTERPFAEAEGRRTGGWVDEKVYGSELSE